VIFLCFGFDGFFLVQHNRAVRNTMVAQAPATVFQGFAPDGAPTGLMATGNVAAPTNVTTGKGGVSKIEKGKLGFQLGKATGARAKAGKVLHEIWKARRKRAFARKAR